MNRHKHTPWKQELIALLTFLELGKHITIRCTGSSANRKVIATLPSKLGEGKVLIHLVLSYAQGDY